MTTFLIDSGLVPDLEEFNELSGDARLSGSADAYARGARFLARVTAIEAVTTPAPGMKIRLTVTYVPTPGSQFVHGSLRIMLRTPTDATLFSVEPNSRRVRKSATQQTEEQGANFEYKGLSVGLNTKSSSIPEGEAVVLLGVTGGRDASWNFNENPFTQGGLEPHYDLSFIGTKSASLACDIRASARLRVRGTAGAVDRFLGLILPQRKFETALAFAGLVG